MSYNIKPAKLRYKETSLNLSKDKSLGLSYLEKYKKLDETILLNNLEFNKAIRDEMQKSFEEIRTKAIENGFKGKIWLNIHNDFSKACFYHTAIKESDKSKATVYIRYFIENLEELHYKIQKDPSLLEEVSEDEELNALLELTKYNRKREEIPEVSAEELKASLFGKKKKER